MLTSNEEVLKNLIKTIKSELIVFEYEKKLWCRLTYLSRQFYGEAEFDREKNLKNIWKAMEILGTDMPLSVEDFYMHGGKIEWYYSS